MKTAWLIERDTDEGYKWISFRDGEMGWTTESGDALKFADRQSAEDFGNAYGLMDGMDAQAIEHCWPDGY